jgi:glycosyltransferase involved in cell wall biosynthesis
MRRFARHLRKQNIAVLQTGDYYTNVFGMFAATLARTPLRIAARRQASIYTGAKRALELLAYRQAHVVVANSEMTRQELIEEGVPAEKVVVIHNALEMERVNVPEGLRREEARAMLGLPLDRPIVTVMANLRFTKDHPMFLRAAARVHAEMDAAAFVLAGDGALMEPLRTLARDLGIGADTYFLGQCDHVAELLFASDVCALSSWAEGFSNALLEYMAAGRPVVATDVGGAREVIQEGETGYLVPARDDAAIAARLLTLLRDPVRGRAMGARGKRIVAEKFSPQARLQKTMCLYEKHLADREKGRGKREK